MPCLASGSEHLYPNALVKRSFLGHLETIGSDIKHVQEGLNIEAVSFKLKPYAGDAVTEFELRWEQGFSAATLIGQGNLPSPQTGESRDHGGTVGLTCREADLVIIRFGSRWFSGRQD